MKVKGKPKNKLGDWKSWYIADQLGITNAEASQLKAGKTIEVSKARLAEANQTIVSQLREIKTEQKKRIEMEKKGDKS